MTSWHFVNVSVKASAEIKKRFGKARRGFGSLKVKVTLGGTTWNTSIFPSKEGYYVLPLKAAVRKREGVVAEQTVSLIIELLI